jgi:hypothetical protein
MLEPLRRLARVADIDPVRAKEQLEAYAEHQKQYSTLQSSVTASWAARRGHSFNQGEEQRGRELTQSRLAERKSALMRDADEIARLLHRVNVTGFSPAEPWKHRDTVVRGIGEYGRWIDTGKAPPKPKKSIGAATEGGTPSKPQPTWLVVLVAVISALPTGFVGNLISDELKCEPNIERKCESLRNGTPRVALCNKNGIGWGDCRVLEDPAPTPPAPSPPPPAPP